MANPKSVKFQKSPDHDTLLGSGAYRIVLWREVGPPGQLGAKVIPLGAAVPDAEGFITIGVTDLYTPPVLPATYMNTHFRISAINQWGESAFVDSPTVGIGPLPAPPSEVTVLV